jgi:hypothetical protein
VAAIAYLVQLEILLRGHVEKKKRKWAFSRMVDVR